jgi:hypothetical protein
MPLIIFVVTINLLYSSMTEFPIVTRIVGGASLRHAGWAIGGIRQALRAVRVLGEWLKRRSAPGVLKTPFQKN